MPYIPTVLSADHRSKLAMTPLRLQNWYARELARGENKPVRASVNPTPGRVSRLDMGGTIQGIYAENGVRGGLLHVVVDGVLKSVSSSWAATTIGTIGSGASDYAEFAGLRSTLYVVQDGDLWGWDGATLAQVTDVDLPADVETIMVLSNRLVVSELDADTITWSETLDGASIEALAFATAEQRPDILRRLTRLSGQMIAFGATSIEIHRPTGDSDLPFANITAQSIDETEGLLGKYATCRRGDKLFFIGGNLQPYLMSGLSLDPVPVNSELEDVLRDLTEAERLEVQCWAHSWGADEFFKVRPPGSPAFVFNRMSGLWHTEKTWEQTTYKPRFHAKAYGYDVVADEGGSVLYTLDQDTYSDAGTTVERIATMRPRFDYHDTVGSFCVDLRAFDRPQSGQGSDPTLMIDVSNNGVSVRDDSHSEIMLPVGADGTYLKPTAWGLGAVAPGEGVTIGLRLTDPVGMSLYGAWLNEGQV